MMNDDDDHHHHEGDDDDEDDDDDVHDDVHGVQSCKFILKSYISCFNLFPLDNK